MSSPDMSRKTEAGCSTGGSRRENPAARKCSSARPPASSGDALGVDAGDLGASAGGAGGVGFTAFSSYLEASFNKAARRTQPFSRSKVNGSRVRRRFVVAATGRPWSDAREAPFPPNHLPRSHLPVLRAFRLLFFATLIALAPAAHAASDDTTRQTPRHCACGAHRRRIPAEGRQSQRRRSGAAARRRRSARRRTAGGDHRPRSAPRGFGQAARRIDAQIQGRDAQRFGERGTGRRKEKARRRSTPTCARRAPCCCRSTTTTRESARRGAISSRAKPSLALRA